MQCSNSARAGRRQGAGQEPDQEIGEELREPNPNRDPTQNRPPGGGQQRGGRQDPETRNDVGHRQR